MVSDPNNPNTGAGGGIHHKFRGGPTSPQDLVDPAGRKLTGFRNPRPRKLPAPKTPKAPRTPTTHTSTSSRGGATGGGVPHGSGTDGPGGLSGVVSTGGTLSFRAPVFMPKTDGTAFFGDEKPGTVVVLFNPATGLIMGMVGGVMVPFGHHPLANGRQSAQAGRAGPHAQEPVRAVLGSYDAPTNTAQVYPTDQPDGPPQTVHVNPDITPARLVAGAVVGVTWGTDADPTDGVVTHVAQ